MTVDRDLMAGQARFLSAFWAYLQMRAAQVPVDQGVAAPVILRVVVVSSGDLGLHTVAVPNEDGTFGIEQVPDLDHIREVGAHDSYLLIAGRRLERVGRVASPHIVVCLSWDTLMGILGGEATLIRADGTRQLVRPFTVAVAAFERLLGVAGDAGFAYGELARLGSLIEACRPELRGALGLHDGASPITPGAPPTGDVLGATTDEARELASLAPRGDR